MRLGGPVPAEDPERWIAALRRKGYTAAYCPVSNDAPDDKVQAFAKAAREAGIVIAEVGAWSNPIGPDQVKRRQAVEYCQKQLALAERIGARCCVNIAGSRGTQWDGPHPDNLTDATYDLIVETVRGIMDAVKPTRTYYTLETMPWAPPDSADSYVRLLKAIDRPRFAVHMDPVNLVNCPARFYDTGALIRECFAKLGAQVKSCHAKDIALTTRLTVHLDEVRPGLGGLDYAAYLKELNRLDPDTPLMLEHLPEDAVYDQAAAHVREVAQRCGITFR
jgi:sugar phosphate isomerase/epimerase